MARIISKRFEDKTITITPQKAAIILHKQGDSVATLRKNSELGIAGTGCKIKWNVINNKYYIRTYGCPLDI